MTGNQGIAATRMIETRPSPAVWKRLERSLGLAPLSLAVLGSLDTRIEVPEGHRSRLRAGGRLAVSVEPPGGAPGGKPTGPVILVGPIKT